MKNKKTFKNFCIAIISISSFLYSACGENNVSSGNSFQENGNLSISIMPENNQDNNEIIIDEIKALISEVEIESEPSGQSQYVSMNPFVLRFNEGIFSQILTNKIPFGNYSKLKFKVHKPEDNETPPDPEFKEGNSGNQRYSFIIKGSYNGSAFTYKSKKSASVILNFPNNVNFQESSKNITISVNTSGIFKNGIEIIDPTNPEYQDLIDDNIRASFRKAFIDLDKNGLPD